MHRAFLEREPEVELLILLSRGRAARAEFYRMAPTPPAPREVRFQVVSRGHEVFRVVDLVNGEICTCRRHYAAALDFAIRLEEKIRRTVV